MNKPAAIYARVSSDRQKENHTIASQTAALIEYAQKNGYSVPPEWVFQDEGYSGAILVRPGLEGLRDLAAEGQIVAVLVYSPDRLSRKLCLSGVAERGAVAMRSGVGLFESASRSHTGGSVAGAVSGHDCRIRARPDCRALPARQKSIWHSRAG